MAELPANRFKAALAARQRPLRLWCTPGDAVPAEICAGTGFDLLLQRQSVAPYPVSAVARPPIGTTAAIKQLLDIGVQNC